MLSDPVYAVRTGQFPFLIGTVRTNEQELYYQLETEVSIPHRYGKNMLGTEPTRRCQEVSIPHRYGKNLRVGEEDGI